MQKGDDAQVPGGPGDHGEDPRVLRVAGGAGEGPRHVAAHQADRGGARPGRRAVSDYAQTLAKRPGTPAFRSLALRGRSGTGPVDPSWSAVRIGLYAEHLEAWRRYFPPAQMLFVSGEALVREPAAEVGRVQDFLGLAREVGEGNFYFNRTKGFPCLVKEGGGDGGRPHCLGKTKGRAHPEIHPRTLQTLRRFYAPHNRKFYRMTGHDFGWD
ncbi:hypothetical protein AAFF_G00199350 [Aldrovandia affinis]|uniref:Sulfotransferase n=1 Tax=Aldrovandia affinis TaxID=143900 RepID=A0AAD7RID1_9TELE|nr:hypothetical protein AAFF_G00199350 [Aldrovandia affinis]